MSGAGKGPTARRAADALRDLILSGEMPPGSDYLESELAERLGMSRTPVREAALALEAEGLLEVRPRKGVRILPVSLGDMREVYDVLTALESLSAARAAAAGYGPDDLAALTNSIEEMDAALLREDRPAWAEADDAFHTELVRLGGNGRVIDIVSRMRNQVRRARTVTLYVRPLPLQSNAEHRAVVEAILAGDATAAETAHRRHREAAGRLLVGLLEQMGLMRV